MSLDNKKISVTGATGFIGGRLAKLLALEQKAVVTGTGRELSKVPAVKDAGVDLRRIEITDRSALHAIVQGQDIIFHLVAAGGTNNNEVAEKVNVAATAELLRQAHGAGVSRFIHVSTIAVYGAPNGQRMDENGALDLQQKSLCGRTKAKGEFQLRELASDLGIALVIIRPGMVFGPRGRSWTINPFKLVKNRFPVIFGDGSGFAHLIYVDNLVDGLILAAIQPEAAGETFNFVYEPLSWYELFDYYGQMCHRRPRRIPLGLAKAILVLAKPLIGRTESPDELLAFYTNRANYPNAKAIQHLKYNPHVSLEHGMKQTERWLKEEGYF
jgi:nucleoside-diphosphate-sugar epimerase